MQFDAEILAPGLVSFCWMLAAALASLALVLVGDTPWSGQASPSGADSSLLAFLPLVIFPEGFINGAIMSMLIVYRPDWVRLYDERFYIQS